MYHFDPLRALRVAQSLSVKIQPYLPHVTPRIPRSVHAKFYADWTKTVGARGIQTNGQTDRVILIILVMQFILFSMNSVLTIF